METLGEAVTNSKDCVVKANGQLKAAEESLATARREAGYEETVDRMRGTCRLSLPAPPREQTIRRRRMMMCSRDD